MWKNNHVVMLPTQSKAVRLGQLVIGTGNNLFSSRKSNDIGSLTAYELYITSNEEMKEGYYGLSALNEVVLIGKLYDKSLYKKIIATTDTSLKVIKLSNLGENWKDISLPQPSQQFIEKYIKEYNKGNVISDVEVEYDKATYDKWIENGASPVFDTLKVNPDNIINIKPIKESWNREEVVEFAYKLLKATGKDIKAEMVEIRTNPHIIYSGVNKWIEDNL